ncbi:MAG: thiamine-binding protein [Actinomycetota bacterium]|nr:thiamine-binding protein [Actinomycetota bacterium]
MGTVAEFTIEPFVEGEPGPHVRAAIAAAEAAGLVVRVGPFGTSVEGGSAAVLDAVDAVVRAAVDHGATRVSLQLTVVDAST